MDNDQLQNQLRDETTLAIHNIACAASVIAANRSIKPQGVSTDTEMDKIIAEVTNAYKYTIWKLSRYNQGEISSAIEKSHSTSPTWRE